MGREGRREKRRGEERRGRKGGEEERRKGQRKRGKRETLSYSHNDTNSIV
jgi:hypothetical protein